jgi:hypothetical protein
MSSSCDFNLAFIDNSVKKFDASFTYQGDHGSLIFSNILDFLNTEFLVSLSCKDDKLSYDVARHILLEFFDKAS